ncbi:uncharacterized protein LOC135811414 [Sycon ciliatum]|uniref:uncharacterized protein LOC135811414 n=1 Tax=Sycon ciliatum TaxID=27933 RepID=UPI0031F6B3AB
MECIEERESPQELSTSRHEDWTCIVGGNEQQDSPETLSTSTENTQASSILERTVHTVSELLLPYLALDDIQALSLVSRRFNRLFQNDGYLRRFLQMSLGLRPDSIPTGGGRHAMFAMLTAEARSLAGMLRCGGIEEDEGHKSRTCYMDLNVLRENPLFDVPLFLLKTSSWYTFTRLTFHDIQNAFGLNPTLDVFRDSTFLPMNDLQLSLDGGATIRPSTIFEHYRGRLRQGTIELYQSGLTTSNPFNQLKYNVSDIGAMSRRRKFESDADYRLALLTNIREHFDTIEPQQKRLLSCYRRFLKVLASWHQAEFVTIPELKSVGVGSPYLMGLYAAQMLPRTFQPAMQHCVNTHPALVDYIEGDLFISPITYIQACFVFEIRTPSVQAKDSAARKAVYLKIGEYLKLQQSQGVFFSVQELANVMIRFLDNN